MTGIVKLLSLAVTDSSADTEILNSIAALRSIAISCGVGLFVSLRMANQGFDLGTEFF